MNEIILKKLMKDKLLYMFVTITIKILTNDTSVIEFFVLAQNVFIRKIRIYYIKISQIKNAYFNNRNYNNYSICEFKSFNCYWQVQCVFEAYVEINIKKNLARSEIDSVGNLYSNESLK